MYGVAEKIFYSLSAMILGAAFFVISPNHNSSVRIFQSSVQHEFTVAAIQVFGDQPIFANVSNVISGVNDFYSQSADAAIALLTPAPSEADMFHVAQNVYTDFAIALGKQIPSTPNVVAVVHQPAFVAPANFMQEEPVANIIPSSKLSQSKKPAAGKTVSGANVAVAATAVNDRGYPWVNLRDNDTGEVYCVAIYNSEVNRYLGPCKNDIH